MTDQEGVMLRGREGGDAVDEEAEGGGARRVGNADHDGDIIVGETEGAGEGDRERVPTVGARHEQPVAAHRLLQPECLRRRP